MQTRIAARYSFDQELLVFPTTVNEISRRTQIKSPDSRMEGM
jgi:hypothetical protein